MGDRSKKLADRFEQTASEFAKTLEEIPDAKWSSTCDAEGWTVAGTAQHVSGQFPLEREFIVAAAEGSAMPKYTWADINGMNEARADKNSSASKSDVLRELKDGVASMATYIRGLDDEQLDRTGALGLADGAQVSAQQLIEGGVLIAHLEGHLESIRKAM